MMEQKDNQTLNITSRGLDKDDHFEPVINPNQMEIEVDLQEENYVKELKNKVMFAIQGLGSVNTIIRNRKKFQTYIKGSFCQESVKDLVKLLRHDKPDCQYVRIILSDYNIIQSDLLQLLSLHLEDKKLTFWLIALMALMTNYPNKSLSQAKQQKIRNSLVEYKQSFVKHQALTNLIVHIADYFKLPKQKRFTAYLQMLQFSLILIRNLLQVKGNSDQQLHFRFILAMIREEIFNPILYLIQLKDNPQVLDKVQILLMEICYHTFTCFEPQQVYQTKKKSNLILLAAEAKKKYSTNTRHSRFMPIFHKKQTYQKKIVHQLTNSSENLENQRKMPNRICDLMKIQKIGHRFMAQNFMIIQLQSESGSLKVKTIIFQLCKQFLQIEFQQLCRLIFPLIKSNSQKLAEQHFLYYILLAEWAITMTTNKYQQQLANANSPLERSKVQYDLMQIVYIVQSQHFQYLYNILYTEVTKKLKRHFRHNYFHAELSLFYRYIEVISILKQSNSISDRKNSVVLMGYMFKHQIARVLKLAFENVIEIKVKKILIIIIEVFFTLLEQFTHGRAISVTTNRQVRSKVKKPKNNKEQHCNFMQREIIESYPERYQGLVSTQNQQYLILQQKIKNNKQIEILNTHQLRFQQKKCNIISEFACIASYEIIEHYLFFLKKQNINLQQSKFIKSIFYYIQKVVSLLKGQWLFFQMKTLVVFQEHLQNRQLDQRYKQIIKHICKCFIKLLKANSLALAQTLFRFPSLVVKDQIMSNYEKAKETVIFQSLNKQNPLKNGFTQNFTDNGTVIPQVQMNEPFTQEQISFGHSQYLGSLDMPFMD